jgi:hypothetical protein
MRRTALAAGLAIALLGAVALSLVSRVTGRPRHSTASHPYREVQPERADAPPPAGWAPAGTEPSAPQGGQPPAPARAGPSGRTAAGGAPAAPRASRAERRLLRAQQVKEKLAARRSEAPPPGPQQAGAGLPPEERAAMQAAGLDWKKVERMMKGAAAHDESVAAGEEGR